MALKKSLSVRRVPRKIGGEEDEDVPAQDTDNSQGSVVKRPISTGKAKKKSSLRMSFGPSEADEETGNGASGSDVVTPKKSNLSRVALENKAKRSSLSNQYIPFRADSNDDQPSYSKEYLEELKQSTPSTPRPSDQTPGIDDIPSGELDIAAKFGPLAALQSSKPSFIPSEAEIREKKERRRRLAKEEQFMPLAGSEQLNSDDDNLTDDEFKPRRPKTYEIAEWKEQQKYGESRLEREDEDIAEGFDDYVEDGKIMLGRKAERAGEKKRRTEMASMIADAEGHSSDDGSDDSEAERNAAYEAAQARAGAYGSHDKLLAERDEQHSLPKMTPLPNLQDVTQRLRAHVKQLDEDKAKKMRRLEELRAERAQVKVREEWIQSQLKETGERYEKLRLEAGMSAGAATPSDTSDHSKLVVGRGLESLGATPLPARSDGEDIDT